MHARSGIQYGVRKGLTLAAAYNSFWLANRRDGIYGGGKVTIASNGAEGSHIGQEADVQGQWTATRHTLVDLAFGHIFEQIPVHPNVLPIIEGVLDPGCLISSL